MDFSTVVKSLRSIDIEQVRLDNPIGELWSVQQITSADQHFQPDILYLGRLSQLERSISQPAGPISLLLLKDSTLPDILLSRSRLNLALLPESTILTNVFPRLQAVLLDSSRIISGMGVLLDALLEDKGLQQLAEAAAQVFQMPVLITDSSFKYLAHARGGPGSPEFNELDVRSGYIADSLVQEIQERRLDEQIRKAGKPLLIRSNRGDEYLVSPVAINHVEVAHISLLTGGQPIGVVEREMLRRFSQVVATELQKNNFFKVNRGTPHASFLADLFENKINTLIDVRKRLSLLGFSLKKVQQVISISIRDHIASEGRLQMIINQLRKLIPESIQMIYLGDLVFLASSNSPQGLPADKLGELADFLQASKLTGGLSSRFLDILDARRHYIQARRAAVLGANNAGDKSLHIYELLLAEQLAEACAERLPLSDLIHPAITMLLLSDRQQDGVLLDTLRIYLQCARNPTKAAAALAIHRNTLFYRINRIAKLTGIDFEDGDELMRLSLSFKLMVHGEFENSNRE
jgi:sugar diacid utilization regulator